MSRALAILGVVLVLASPTPALAQESKRQQTLDNARAKIMEGEMWAEAEEYETALERWREGYVALLPMFRELPFKHPVQARYLTREELGSFVLEEMAEEYPDEEIEAERLAFSRLGFFEPDLDLKELITTLFTEEIAGFYDPDEKALFLIRETPTDETAAPSPEDEKPEPEEPEDEKPKGFLERLFGGDDEEEEVLAFDPAEEQLTLAHELIHALTDQHHDLLSMSRSAEHDDDMMLAQSALMEGDASLAMLIEPFDEELGRYVLQRRSLSLMMRWSMRFALPTSGDDTFSRAPLLYRESLLFPYVEGFAFCQSLTSEGSWAPVDRAYKDPPLSTEQILHPEKYPKTSRKYDPPMEITLPDGMPLDSEAWKLVDQNVLGELAIGLLFRPELGRRKSERAAEGWDGDRYAVFARRDAPEETALIWVSTWDTEKDAKQFAEAFVKMRSPQSKPRKESRKTEAGTEYVESFVSSRGSASLIRRGVDVIVLEDLPEGARETARRWAGNFGKNLKTYTLEKHDAANPFPGEK